MIYIYIYIYIYIERERERGGGEKAYVSKRELLRMRKRVYACICEIGENARKSRRI